MDRSTAEKVLNLLEEEYPEAKCALNHRNVFQLLICTVLSAQTTDKRVNMVTPELFRVYPDAAALAEADPETVGMYIKSIGLYRTKSKNIVKLAGELCTRFGGEVPGDFDGLVSLPGVGRKTANVVLADGFGEQHIAVDTHVFRVANRIGLAAAENVLKTERQLMEILPEPRWTRAHHLIIFHGRNCCSSKKPECGRCCIGELCENNGMD